MPTMQTYTVRLTQVVRQERTIDVVIEAASLEEAERIADEMDAPGASDPQWERYELLINAGVGDVTQV